VKTQRSSTPNRTYGLDVLRAVAVSAVLISHGRFWLRSLGPATERLRVFGYFGVELFFVLSGFLIGGILIRHLRKDVSLQGLWVFWIRRWFRTLPNYYLFLLINIVIMATIESSFAWPPSKFLLFLQNFAWANPHFFGEAWSLAVEEWFYLSFPLLLWILSRRLKLVNAVWIACGTIAFVSTAGRIFEVVHHDTHFNTIRKIVVFRLDSLMFGVAAACIKVYYDQLWASLVRHARPLGLALVAGTFGLYIVFERFWLDTSLFGRTLYFSCVSLGVALLLPWFDSWRRSDSVLVPFVERTSLWSYSMYLSNLPLVTLLQEIDFLAPGASSWPLGLAVYLVLTFAISAFIYNVFEIRMTAMRNRFS